MVREHYISAKVRGSKAYKKILDQILPPYKLGKRVRDADNDKIAAIKDVQDKKQK